MERLLSLALARGGTFADLYFEHQTHLVAAPGGGDHPHGLGRRDLRPRGAGRLRRADGLRLHRRPVLAGHGAGRRDRGPHRLRTRRTLPPQPVSPAPVDRRYGEHDASASCRLADRIALVERADRAARAYDPRIEKVIVDAWPSETKQVRIANSAGRAGRGRAAALLDPRVRDRAPRTACGARARAGGGGRLGPGVLRDEAARALRPRGGAHGGDAAAARSRRRRARCRWCSARAGPASCSTRPSATASRATSTARGRRPSPAASASAWPRPGVTVVDDGTIADRRGSLNVDDEGNRPGRTVLIEDGILRGYLQDRLNSGLMKMAPTGNGRRAELRVDPAAAHDQHLHAGGPGRPRGHRPLGAARPLRQALRRRPGGHHERQVRVLGHRGLPDRGRQDRRARWSAPRSSATAPTCSPR